MKGFIEVTKHVKIDNFVSGKEPYIDEIVKILVNIGKIYSVHKLLYSDDKSLQTRITFGTCGETDYIEVIETYEEVKKMIEDNNNEELH